MPGADVLSGADLTTMEEGHEFIARLNAQLEGKASGRR